MLGIYTLIAAMTGKRWMRGLNMTCTRPLIFSFSMPACSSIAFKHATSSDTPDSSEVLMLDSQGKFTPVYLLGDMRFAMAKAAAYLF